MVHILKKRHKSPEKNKLRVFLCLFLITILTVSVIFAFMPEQADAVSALTTASTIPTRELGFGESYVNLGGVTTSISSWSAWQAANNTEPVTLTDPYGSEGNRPVVQARESIATINYSNAGNDIFVSGALVYNQSPAVWRYASGLVFGIGSANEEWGAESYRQMGSTGAVKAESKTLNGRTGFYIKTFPYSMSGNAYKGGAGDDSYDLTLLSRLAMNEDVVKAIKDPMLNVTAKAVIMAYPDSAGNPEDGQGNRPDNPATCNIELAWVSNTDASTTNPVSVAQNYSQNLNGEEITTSAVSLSEYGDGGNHLRITMKNFAAQINHNTTGGTDNLGFWTETFTGGQATSSTKAVSGLSVNIEYIKIVVEVSIPDEILSFNEHNIGTDTKITNEEGSRHTVWNNEESVWDTASYTGNANFNTVKYVKAGDLIELTATLRLGSTSLLLYYSDSEKKHMIKSSTYNQSNSVDSVYRDIMFMSNTVEQDRLRDSLIDVGVYLYYKKVTLQGKDATVAWNEVNAILNERASKYGIDFASVRSDIQSGYSALRSNGTYNVKRVVDVASMDITELQSYTGQYSESWSKSLLLETLPLIQWSYPTEFLEFVSYDEHLTGQTITLRVKENVSELMQAELVISPYLQYWRGGSQFPTEIFPDLLPVSSAISNGMLLLLDSSPPDPIAIKSTDDLYANYIVPEKYYVDGYTDPVKYTTVMGNGSSKLLSAHDNGNGAVISVNLVDSAFNVTGSPHYIFYTTDGTNPLTSNTKKLLFQTLNQNSNTYNAILFFPLSKLSAGSVSMGTFTLQFVAVDYAGNVSSLSERYQVKLDCSLYTVKAMVKQTNVINAPANSSNTSGYGTVYFAKQPASGGLPSASDFKKASEFTLKRNDVFYIQIEVRKQSQYKLYQYYNNGTRLISNSAINYGKWTANSWGDFAVTSQERLNDNATYYLTRNAQGALSGVAMNDEMLANQNNLTFVLEFKEILNIVVGATTVTYDRTEKTIGQPTASKTTSGSALSPEELASIIITTYYVEPQRNSEGVIIVPSDSDFKETKPFTNAGIYYFKCIIDDATYCGELSGRFTINKANPVITELQMEKIYYGDSMAQSVIKCLDTTNAGGQMVQYNTDRSSDGLVPGVFSIIDPVPNATNAAYMTPNQGYHSVTVQFIPDVAYQANYNIVSHKVTLHVDYSSQLVIVFDATSFEHTYALGVQRAAVAFTNPSEPLIYEYKLISQDERYYTTQAPTDAGVYDVRVRTDLSRSNYNNTKTTEDSDVLKFVINRAEVNVSAEAVTTYYQQDYDPPAIGYVRVSGGASGAIAAIESWIYYYSVNGTDWTGIRPVDAGTYQVRAVVDSINLSTGAITGNYRGEGLTTLTIRKGNAGGSANYSIIYPMLSATNNANISYGQKLSAITYMTNADAIARYLFRTDGGLMEQRQVSGSFFIATRQYNQETDGTPAQYKAAMGALVLDAGRYTQTTALYNVFLPDDLVNFNISYQAEAVTIAKTTPDFSNVVLNGLVFENTAEMITMPGYERSLIDGKVVYTIINPQYHNTKLVNPMANGIIVYGTLTYSGRANTPLSAGTQRIAYTFKPDASMEKNINECRADLNVVVEKDEVDLTLSSSFYNESDGKLYMPYGSYFSNPTVTARRKNGNLVLASSYTVTYLYYNYSDLSNSIIVDSRTGVGTYKVVITVTHPNLKATVETELVIEKLVPSLTVLPVVSNVEYRSDMSTIGVSGGRIQHPATNATINGSFSFYDEEGNLAASPDAIGNRMFTIRFTPSDTANVEIIYFQMNINVKKAETVISLSNLEYLYSGTVRQPSAATNVVIRTIDGSSDRVVLSSPSEFNSLTDRYLSVVFSCATTPTNALPVDAGTYVISAEVDDMYYQGTVTATYIIRQVDAFVVVVDSSREQTYNGTTKYLEYYVADAQGNRLSGITVAQSFTSYLGEKLVSSPSDVGEYTVLLEIRDTNYKGSVGSTLRVNVGDVYFSNTLITYGDGKSVIVTQSPASAQKEITYRQKDENGPFGSIMTTMPVYAGTYEITVTYPESLNNGYSGVFKSTLVIQKAVVKLTYEGIFAYSYTGYENTRLASALNSVRVNITTAYTLQRYAEFYINDEFVSTEPVNAGTYLMRVSINDANYSGSAVFEYTVLKASPVIDANPVVQPVTYGDDGQNAIFTGGSILFGNVAISGTYTLAESTLGLDAGIYTKSYIFVPDNSSNLETVYGQVSLIVSKKDMSSEIIFSGKMNVNYNTLAHSISARLSSLPTVAVDVYYNGLKSAPSARGSYTVTAKVSDKNYSGESTWTSKLNINIGIPVIVNPKLSDIALVNGEALVSSTEIRGGYAYIDGIGTVIDGVPVSGTVQTIGGIFSLANPNEKLTSANTQIVKVVFRPYSQDFASVTVDCEIKVIGTDPIMGTVSAQLINSERPIYYGHAVGDYYSLSMSAPSGATPGVLEFIDSRYIPQVGERVQYRFTPYDTVVYNIIYGEVSLDVNKSTAVVDGAIEAKAFYGGVFADSVFDASLINQYNAEVIVDGTFEIISVTGYPDLGRVITVEDIRTIIGGGTLRNASGDNQSQSMLTGRYRFTSANYQTMEGDVYIYFYNEIVSNQILTERASKEFDGKPLSPADIGISVAGTAHPLTDESFLLTVYDAAGRVSDASEIGTYSVTIEIVDSVYYGITTMSFAVTKKDISVTLVLNSTESTYGDAAQRPNVDMSVLPAALFSSNFKLEFKKVSETSASYNETMPSGAGTYDVRVTVVDSDIYMGEAILRYVINKKIIAISHEYGSSYVSGQYGRISALTVGIENGLAEPVVNYFSDTYSMKTTPPTEVGVYTARVSVSSSNYKLYTEGVGDYVDFVYEITQVPLYSRELPLASDIIFGQSYNDSRLTGGRVTMGESTVVAGVYTFVYPSTKPNAGEVLARVRFTPINKNYAAVDVDVVLTVRRADADVKFTNLSVVYNGSNRSSGIAFTGVMDADWEVVFMQNGYEVQPINAGRYNVLLRIRSGNYQFGMDINGDPVLEKENAAVFVIEKASYISSSYVAPRPTKIEYGKSLAYSTLDVNSAAGFGIVSYYGLEGHTAGKFEYVNPGIVLGDAGKYVVEIRFVPENSSNLNSFTSKVEVEVTIASATVVVSNNVYTYGTPIALPTFTTFPSNLTVSHNISFIGQVVDCGIYSFRVWVTSQNYYDPQLPMSENNYFDFTITVQKKTIDLEFVLDGSKVDKYITTYQKILFAKAVTKAGAVLDRDLYSSGGLHIDTKISIYYYTANNVLVGLDGHTPPSAIGDYTVVARLDDQSSNYTGQATIRYDIQMGQIESVSFDQGTLERQVYGGTIVAPIVQTKPSGVQYYIVYEGYERHMPTNAGTYNITVYFNDPNYAPKPVSAIFVIHRKEIFFDTITVQSKAYDGVSSLDIDGTLSGVVYGDEVNYTLEASTRDGKYNVGKHYVTITKASISGLSAENYTLRMPTYLNQITIFEKKITDLNTESFVTSNSGFPTGVTVEFDKVKSEQNGQNVFSNLFGQKATVMSFIIKDNGLSTSLDEMVQVYIKIPEEFKDAENLKIVGLGDLANRQINFIIKDDYITFYTDCSGEVAISTNDFNYWTIGVIAALIVIVAGIVMLIMLNPMHKRTSTSDAKKEKEYKKALKKGQVYEE